MRRGLRQGYGVSADGLRAVHVLVVRVVVSDFGVVQLIVQMRRIMPVFMQVSVLMVMRMAVGMLVHHVAVVCVCA